VEQLIDEWLADHPDSPRIAHIEEVKEGSSVGTPSAEAAASVGAADPEGVTPQEAPAQAGA
jgi:hypothetical protein